MGQLPGLWDVVLVFVGLPLAGILAVAALAWWALKFRSQVRPPK